MLTVLIGCESSGVMREAFRNLGHDAYSCDLLPADDGSGNHIQDDVFYAIASRHWDLIILHPPCTAMCVSGNAHYGTGKPKHHKRQESIDWTLDLWRYACRHSVHVALENPVSVIFKHLDVPVSYVQPYEHGHPESKKTGFALYNLPSIEPTNVLDRPACGHWDNQTPSGQNKLGPSKDRWKIRSRTYPGIAKAVAEQWSNHITGEPK